MWQIGVWEQQEGLAEQISRLAEGAGLVRACSHPALLAGVSLDLLIISPSATGWAGASSLSCTAALLPGAPSALIRSLPPCTVISYGAGHRNTLSLSGLDGEKASVSVQREFHTLGGKTVDRQELVLPWGDGPPDLLLAQVGAALLLERI